MNRKVKSVQEILDLLPNKRYFSIGEISHACGLKPYVLRYWEQEFEQLSPIKRNGRRYYQESDLKTLVMLQDLLHVRRYTILGAREYLSDVPSGGEGQVMKKIDRGVRIQKVLDHIDGMVDRLNARIDP